MRIRKNEVTGGIQVAGPLMREAVMKPADAGDEKLTTDVVPGDELANDDLAGVTGGSSPIPYRFDDKADAPPTEIV